MLPHAALGQTTVWDPSWSAGDARSVISPTDRMLLTCCSTCKPAGLVMPRRHSLGILGSANVWTPGRHAKGPPPRHRKGPPLTLHGSTSSMELQGAAIGAPTPGGISRAARRRGWPVPPARRSPRADRGMARGGVLRDHGAALHPPTLPATGATSNAPRDQARRSDGSGLRASGAHLGCRHALAETHLGVRRPAAPFPSGLSRCGPRSEAGGLLRLSHARLRVVRRRSSSRRSRTRW